eukprot:XP_011674684.1 PREDICTED: dynein heavy chain 5, axonemal-like [Strongylocentrotus purpuratus]
MALVPLFLLLEENKRVCSKIQPAFEPLMETHLDKLNRVLDPGLTALTWTSMNIDPFVEDVYAALGELELLMVRASDLCQFRINVVLKEMSEIQLCELPEDEAWTTDQFLKRTQELSNKGAVMLQVKSIQVEEAANELINMLLAEPDVEEKEEERR